MRRGALTLAGLVSVFLLASSLPAAAYMNVGYDPQDSDSEDISSTALSVQRGEHARRLRVIVHTYDEAFWPDSYFSIDARLDARGGRAADATLHMWIMDMSGSGCELTTRSGRVLERGRFRSPDATTVVCRVRVHPLHPTKAIRWKVTIIDDVAPDVGMYG
jgi:hypothetical protein